MVHHQAQLYLEPHTTLYQFIVNHQMQANAIAHHTGTPSAAATTYESHLEHVRTFCQMIDHTNCKAVQEKTRRKALQAEFERAKDMDRTAGEKDMAMGGVETLGVVGNLKDKEGALVGGTTTGFLVNSLINLTMSHMHSSSGIVLHMGNWLPTTQKLP